MKKDTTCAVDGCTHGEENVTCDCSTKEPEKPKTVLSRSEVYDFINGERAYQDNKWRHLDDSEWSINDWVVFIERYLKEIKEWTGHPREQMDAMRKVAALAVAAMEFRGSRPREKNGKINLKEQ